MKFPNIDQNQARRQLELLGYQGGDNIYLRFFYPSDDPRKSSDKGRKCDRLKWEQIEAYQRQGRGVYFVINGGGHKNLDVQFGRAVFIEHDHLPKEVQRELWKSLGLPEPTFQLDTGGKSVHSYWVPKEPIPIDQWRELQRDLLEFTDADRSIKNPARVMRLAGAWHISINGDGNPVYQQSRIISDCGKKYSFEELRASVPAFKAEEREKWTAPEQGKSFTSPNPKSQIPNPKHPDQIQIPVPEPVPLLECCRKEVREWVAAGVRKGQKRNDTAINVGLELVAVERHLQQIGQSFTSSARQLFAEYCRNSGMTAREEEERFQWCRNQNPTPSCRDEGIAACIRGWYWREYLKPLSSSTNRSNYNHSNGKGNGNPQERESEVNMRSELKKILAKDYSLPELTEVFNQLSLDTFWSVREIRQLAAEMDDNFEQEYSRRERQAELQQLQTYKLLTLDLHQLLPPSYAEPMTQMAKWMEAPTAAFLTGFLPMFASCLHPETRIIVKECIGFIEPPIIYSGIVTESGQRKSPILNALADPLKDLQAEEERRYRHSFAEYEREYAQWQAQKDTMTKEEWKDAEPTPPQKRREFYVDKATIEAIDMIKGEQQDTGLIWVKDELSGLFNGYNAYKKGRGDDKESILSGWNGRGVKKNLKGGERIFLKNDSMSILGAIQDVTLQKKMGNFDDEQGEWARFLWCLIPLKALRLPKKDTRFYLAFLKNLYEKARSLPARQYRFTTDAQRLYDDYHWQLELRRTSHPQRGMRAAISKMEGYTARLALVLYLIWELEAGNQPGPYIPKEFVEAAIILSEFYLSQVNLIHADGAASLGEGGLTPRLNVILDKLKQFGELTARKVQSTVNWLRKVKASVIRQDFIELVKLGYGQLKGQGNKLKIILSAGSAGSAVATAVESAVAPPSAQTINLQDLQPPSTKSAESAVTAVKSQLNEDVSPISEDVSPISEDVSSINGLEHQVINQVEQEEINHYPEEKEIGFDKTPDQQQQQHNSSLPSNLDEQGNVAAELSDAAATAPTADLEPETPSHPSLEDLKALLLACKTLVELKALKKSLGQRVYDAYNQLTSEQQLQVDAVAATEVPYKVYKYMGETIERDGKKLSTGTLVYIDPNHTRKGSRYVPVWLLRGVQVGWRQAVKVSKDCLLLVEKVVAEVTEMVEGNGGGENPSLLDGLT